MWYRPEDSNLWCSIDSESGALGCGAPIAPGLPDHSAFLPVDAGGRYVDTSRNVLALSCTGVVSACLGGVGCSGNESFTFGCRVGRVDEGARAAWTRASRARARKGADHRDVGTRDAGRPGVGGR